VGLFPVLLRSRTHPALSLTVENSGEASASGALVFWIPAFLLAVGYLVYILRTLGGPARAVPEGEGH
jgi:hypothetical protein